MRSGDAGFMPAGEAAGPAARSLLGDSDAGRDGGRDYEQELMLWRTQMARLEERIGVLGHSRPAEESDEIDALRVRLIAQLEWLRIAQPQLSGNRLPID